MISNEDRRELMSARGDPEVPSEKDMNAFHNENGKNMEPITTGSQYWIQAPKSMIVMYPGPTQKDPPRWFILGDRETLTAPSPGSR
jgi:hypothetical protein